MSDTYNEIKIKANIVRIINLKTILCVTDAIQNKFDNKKWHTPQGVISVNGAKFMNWNQGIGGGGAIDLIIHLKKIDFKTAVIWLHDKFLSIDIQSENYHNNIPNRILRLPLKDETKLPGMIRYLQHDRFLPISLINSLICSGKLYADIRGNAVFLLLGNEKKIVGAELRGTKYRWHGLAHGSKKNLGYFYISCLNPKKIVICESAIDAISFFAISPDCLALSTSGVYSNPGWLNLMTNKGYEIYCGFDSDAIGDSIAQNMIKLYPTVKRLRPALHDWNDVLENSIKS